MPVDIELIKEELEHIQSLPTLPTIATKLIHLLDSESVSMQALAKVMVLDPALTSRILKIVNSAYYGVRNQIDTIDLALVLLGMNEVRNVLLSVSLIRTFQVQDSGFKIRDFWEHSIAVAHFAKTIAHDLRLPTHGEEFTAGLLHDIGKLIIAQYFPEDAVEIKDVIEADEISNFEAEEKVLGLSHMDIGAWLAEKWKIPEHIANTIRYHHYPQLVMNDKALVHLVSLADELAHYYHFGTGVHPDMPHLVESESWKVLNEHAGRTLTNVEEYLLERNTDMETIRNYITVALG
jgi:putative nucleotidyltransferase with HDIG domain